MEEILASIRRIISEDNDPDSKPSDDQPPPLSAPSVNMDEDVLELTQMVQDDGTVVSVQDDSVQDDADESWSNESQDALIARPEPEVNRSEVDDMDSPEIDDEMSHADIDALMSDTTAAATTAAFSQLAGKLDRDRDVPPGGGLPLGGVDRTLEDIVKELLRPMLREWVDQNLPQIVERQVRRQIEKLVRQAETE